MAEQEVDKSLHIKPVLGRPLMCKRTPTKRTFTFHLPKFGRTKKNRSKKENLSRSKKNKSIQEITGLNESPFEHSTSFLSSRNTSAQKNILKDKTNVANAGVAAVQHKLVAVKSLENALAIPISGSKPCERFETPFLPLLPLATLQRKLVDACGSFGHRTSSETSRSTISTNSSSKIAVPGLLIPNRSGTSIHMPNASSVHLLSNNGTKCDKKENGLVRKRNSQNTSILEYFNLMNNVSKTRSSKVSGITDISIDNAEKSKHTRLIDLSRKLSTSFNVQTSSKTSTHCDEANNEEHSLRVMPSDQSIPKTGSRQTSISEKDELLCNISENKLDLIVVPQVEKRNSSVPLCNDPGQAKRRKIVLQNRGDTESINDAVSPHSRGLDPDILLISPLNNKRHQPVLFKTNKNSQEVDSIQEKEKTSNELQCAQHLSNFVRLGSKRKCNIFGETSGENEKSSHLPETENISAKSTELPSKENKLPLPKELMTRMLRKISRKNCFKYQILPNEPSNFSQITKEFKEKQPRKRPTISSSQVTEIPEKTKALLWKNASAKHNSGDVTDLEIAMYIFAKSVYDARDQTSDVHTYQALRDYEKAVVKDMTDLISRTVELENKRKEIKKLERELNRKGKTLGSLIDERHKLSHQAETGHLHLKK